MRNKWYLLFLLTLLIASSCKTTRLPADFDRVKKISPKILDNQLAMRKGDFDWFSARIKMKYDDGSINQSFTANVRYKKDSVVWMSLTGMFGIEGGRVLITKDSIQIIDRLKKTYFKFPLTYIEKYIPFQLSISDIQQIFVGNQFVPMDGKKRIVVDQKKYVVSSSDKNIESTYWVYPKNYTYAEMRLKDRVENRQLSYKFGNYKEVEDKLIAFTRALQFVNGTNDVKVDMNFTKIRVNEPLDFPFEVSPKYK